ncbi:MAG: T9SS type A sorting domain-containing protein [Bacteroidales bacterium]|nr:T9SS type A sorting domain-containing protein [Bacteroidales bacterium]
MKKFYMILAALLIGSVCFAQNLNIQFHKMDTPINGAERSAWVGNNAMDGSIKIAPGLEYAIAPKAFNANLSGNITKVKFYHGYDVERRTTNTSYTIKIYTNPSLGGNLASQGFYNLTATEAYTQDYTAGTEPGWQEVELTNAFAVPSEDFWVAIKANNDTAALALGGSASAVEGQSYFQYTVGTYGTFWTTPAIQNTLYNVGIAIYVDDGAVYVPTFDFEARWWGGVNSNNMLTPAEASYTLGTTESLSLIPTIKNNGAEDAVEGTVTVSVTVGGQAYGTPITMTLNGTEQGSFPVSEAWTTLQNTPLTITAEEMNAMNLPETFDVCLNVTYSGNDPNTANNSHCIPVTRTNAVCDIQAKLYTDAQGTTEVASAITISLTDSFTVYPAILNAGPNEAAGTLTIDVTINGTSIIGGAQQQSFASQPIPVNEAISIIQGGAMSFTPEQMDQVLSQLGITNGIFEVCIIANYSGNDPNTANNTKCVTVTRSSSSDIYTITVRANNDTFGTVTGGGSYAAGAQATLTATANQGYVFVKWAEDENTDNPRTITVNADATYTAVFQALGAVDDETISGIAVYPNPANDMFTVANAEGATIVVVNSLGQVVASIENAASNQTIDASSLATGTYFVKVNEKIVKINVVK